MITHRPLGFLLILIRDSRYIPIGINNNTAININTIIPQASYKFVNIKINALLNNTQIVSQNTNMPIGPTIVESSNIQGLSGTSIFSLTGLIISGFNFHTSYSFRNLSPYPPVMGRGDRGT